MSLRLDLLLNDEKREVGALSYRTRIMLLCGLLVLALVIWLGMQVNAWLDVSSEVKQLAARKAEQEKHYAACTNLQYRLTRIRAELAELDHWSTSRVAWAEILMRIGTNMPASVQLTGFEYNSAILPPAKVAGKKDKAPPPPRINRKHELTVNGERMSSEHIAYRDAIQRLRSDTMITNVLGTANAYDAGGTDTRPTFKIQWGSDTP